MAKLLVGLGNPTQEYTETRHNVGFKTLEAIADYTGTQLEFDKKINGEIAYCTLFNESVVLLKPHTSMNKSGEAVMKAQKKFKTKTSDILIIHDDLDIEFGKSKLSFGKGSGGNNGVNSIINHLKTDQFWRLKIGIANAQLTKARAQHNLDAKKTAVVNFVLAHFIPEEKALLREVINSAIDKVKNLF